MKNHLKIISYTIAAIFLLSVLFNSSNVGKSYKNSHEKSSKKTIKQQSVSTKEKDETETQKTETQCKSDTIPLKVFEGVLGKTIKEVQGTNNKETDKIITDKLKQNLRKELLANKSIKKIVIKNDFCGAYTAWRLLNLYELSDLHEEAQKYHSKLVHFASSGNATAIGTLCTSDNNTITKNEKIRYCNLTLKSEDKEASGPYRFEAMMFLSKYYFDIEDGKSLIKICEGIDDKNKNICFFGITYSATGLAEKLYDKEKYEEAYQLYMQIEPYDKKGLAFSQLKLGDMLLQGKGVKTNYSQAVFWYNKALRHQYNQKINSFMLNSIGIAYERDREYVRAYVHYKKAAILGLSEAQFNVSRLYGLGHGIIQSYKEAYAWLSVAIASGLSKDSQARAEKIKSMLLVNLQQDDKTGRKLAEAENLAQQYYEKYVATKAN
ncbi:TPA: tetratricopeptide repeat protein [Legionella pneumophila]|nr:sel1 repeat family protein [Legionella pneumophila]HBD7079176.1 sel1 repeat family protein [Legionella pneumophila]